MAPSVIPSVAFITGETSIQQVMQHTQDSARVRGGCTPTSVATRSLQCLQWRMVMPSLRKGVPNGVEDCVLLWPPVAGFCSPMRVKGKQERTKRM